MRPWAEGAARLAAGLLIGVVLAVGVGLGWRVYDRDAEVWAPDLPSTPELVAHGKYLTQLADCVACHTAPGGKPFAGGLAFKLPFGTIYATNITADPATGIGNWSDDDFVRALHQGIAKDGSHLYPAFPYTSYTGLSRADAVAIKAYLFTLPKVNAPARPNDLLFPFNQRWAMAAWNAAFLDQHRFREDPRLAPRQNRGAYLATALGHCGECHTPRNLAFGMDRSRPFAGAVVRGWGAYNITNDARYGIGGWSDVQLADYLATGHGDRRGSASGPMAEAVANSLQYWTRPDVDALVDYLRTIPPQPGVPGTEIDASPPLMVASTAWAPARPEQGKDLGLHVFESACASCHGWNGAGQQTPYAALAGSQAVNDPHGRNIVRVLLDGTAFGSGQSAVFMPNYKNAYTDAELAAVANYVIGHFGGKVGQVTTDEVKQARETAP